jgi:hypothetical protein
MNSAKIIPIVEATQMTVEVGRLGLSSRVLKANA